MPVSYDNPRVEMERRESRGAGTAKRGWRGGVQTSLLALLLTVLGTGLFGSTSNDDAYITLWQAKSLASHGEILNYNNERAEQSSSLLHTLLLAGLVRVTGWDLTWLAFGVSVLAGVVSMFAVSRLANRLDLKLKRSHWLILLATSPYLVFWLTGTLETTLALLVFVVTLESALHFLSGGTSVLRVALGGLFFVLVRPEAFFVLIGPLGLLYVLSRAGILDVKPRRALVLAAISVSAFLLVTGFRLVYFGEAFPLPVSAKSGGAFVERVLFGLSYVLTFGDFLRAYSWIVIAFLGIGLVAAVKKDGRTWPLFFLGLFTLSGLSFMAVTGGDWMEMKRFFVPYLPLIYLFVLLGISSLSFLEKRASLVVMVLVACHLYGLFVFTVANPLSFRGRFFFTTAAWQEEVDRVFPENRRFGFIERVSRPHLRDLPGVVKLEDLMTRWVAARMGRPAVLMSHQAGIAFYHLGSKFPGQVVFVDGCGLSTRHIALCRSVIDREAFVSPMNLGTCIPYDWMFRYQNALAGCGLEPPDLVFDLDIYTEEMLGIFEAVGYRIVFRTSGVLRGVGLEEDFGPSVRTFIAVREGFPGLDSVVPMHLDWGRGAVYTFEKGRGLPPFEKERPALPESGQLVR